MQLKVDTTLHGGRFKIISCIGDGGFGITYLASDEKLGREVVLKEYFPDYMVKRDTTVSLEVHTLDAKYSDDFHAGIRKFLNEAKILAQFNNIPAIADVYDFFEENNTAYIVMEYIKGQNLRQHIKARTAPYTFKEMMTFIEPCMFALQKVHEAGIIHRDFAPDNILINEKGQVKIIDFGASRDFVANNSTMTIMVKHGYAPAEQYSNAVKQGPYTDVYSLAAIVYEMLTLQKPMPSVDRMFNDTLKNPIEINPQVAPAQNAAVMKGLAVSYANRYQTVEELSIALKACENDVPVPGSYQPAAQQYNTAGNAAQAQFYTNEGQSTELVSSKSVDLSSGQSTELVSGQNQNYAAFQQMQAGNSSMETEVLPSSQYNNAYDTNNTPGQYSQNQSPADNSNIQSFQSQNYQSGYANNQGPSGTKKSKKNLIITLSIVAAVLVLGIIGALVYFNSQDSDSEKKKTKTEKKTTKTETTTTEAAAPAAEEAPAAAEEAEAAEEEAAAPVDDENSGEVFNIYTWNEEFKSRVTDHYPGYEEIDATTGRIGDVTVYWTIVPSDDYAYRNNLDNALSAQGSCDADDRVDMFLAEPDFIQTYVDSDYSMAISDLGITDSELSDQYEYTHVLGSTPSGELKAVTWQVCPNSFIYNRQIAKEVLGSDDPSVVQSYLADFSTMNETVKAVGNHGYKFTATAQDTYKLFTYTDKNSIPLVDGNKLTLSDRYINWAEFSHNWISNGMTTNEDMWSDAWRQGFSDGKVFCYIGPKWFWDYCMEASDSNSVASKGGWGVCMGPYALGSFWGGTYMLVAEGCDNQDLAADIIRKLTTDSSIMTSMGVDDWDCPNSKTAMAKLANDSSQGQDMLGGQNPFEVIDESANNMKLPVQSPYDSTLREIFLDVSNDYLKTGEGKDDLKSYFYREATNKFPHLTHD